jgi:hypothetical protein
MATDEAALTPLSVARRRREGHKPQKGSIRCGWMLESIMADEEESNR